MREVSIVPGMAERRDGWLSADEKEAWTGLISLLLLMPGRLEAPLRDESGLTLFEYLVLSHVSDAPQRRIRMSELAFLANGSLSRLSNVVTRLEKRGAMSRQPDPDDGRYTLAVLTDAGFEMVRAAAPVHVRAVRELVLDPLSVADQQALVRIAAKLKARLPG
ncbi:MAG: MarR family transcriptional regulator [Mycobacterium sp.]|nr:MarR family transcriptional regulator [Mycobacterium sp.]